MGIKKPDEIKNQYVRDDIKVVVSGDRGPAGYRKGKNLLGPPIVTDETMGIKIKERKNRV